VLLESAGRREKDAKKEPGQRFEGNSLKKDSGGTGTIHHLKKKLERMPSRSEKEGE